MKILQVNSFYYDRGGDCTHMFATMDLLRKHGHEVVPFAMKHPLNFKSEYSRYWPSYIDYQNELKAGRIKNALKVFSRAIYSFEAKKCISRILDDEKPDIVHIHNILHHITPSILGVIKKRKIPIVWTLHDYAIICPNTSFVTEEGKVCEACKRTRFYMTPVKRCKKGSLAASFAAMAESYMHRLLNVYRHIDKFIAPSEFLRKKFIEYGMGEKVVTLQNFIEVDQKVPTYDDDGYCVYVGRLSYIKGIDTLLEAVIGIDALKLKIIGKGELLENLQRNAPPQIEFLGFKNRNELDKLIAKSKFVIVPSECYENCPYSIIEAFALGKPVIGSRIGGIPELVEDGKTGLTFEPGNVEDLRSKIMQLKDDANKVIQMGKNARMFAEKVLNSEKHYQGLMRIYKEVIGK